jgi:calcineurin-like phosphoesterase
MVSTTPFVVLTNAVSVALGGVVTHVAYRAHKRTASRPLRWLAAGLAALTAAGALGVADGLVGLDPAVRQLGRAVTLAVGFGLVAVALFQQVE